MLCCILSGTLSGQEKKDTTGFGFFIHSGLNASQVAGDGLSGFNKLNFLIGIGTERKLGESFAGRIEINYAQKGSRKPADPENNDLTEYRMSLSYAQLAPLIEYAYDDKWSLLGGTGIGFLLSSKEEDFFGEIQNNPPFEPLDFSAIFGLRYSFLNQVSAEIRYDQSLIPIRRRESGTSRNLEGRQYNTVLGVIVSYSIR